MIYIEKNKINNFVLTLSENSFITNPKYLFEFKNEFIFDSNSILWTQDDISSHPNRFNQFQLNESATGSTTGGTSISLSLIAGQYDYTVYESTVATLIVSATTGRVIETGRMVVSLDGSNDIITNNTNSFYL